MSDAKEIARQFVTAFDNDNLRAWVDACTAWGDRPYRGRIGQAVKKLRKAWYHNGSKAERAACREAAADLRALVGTP